MECWRQGGGGHAHACDLCRAEADARNFPALLGSLAEPMRWKLCRWEEHHPEGGGWGVACVGCLAMEPCGNLVTREGEGADVIWQSSFLGVALARAMASDASA